jgi:SHS2 domain-containing protein
MPYQYREDIATADVAFEATGKTPEEMFTAASDALMRVMVDNLEAIGSARTLTIPLSADSLDLLLFRLLNELVYYKDAEQLLLRIAEARIESVEGRFQLEADAYGEEIDPEKHHLIVDVKAVTLHLFTVEETPEGWRAFVILDI